MASKNPVGRKRAALREKLFPGSADRVWAQPLESGWAKYPRTTAFLLRALRQKNVSGELDPASTLIDLWDRNMGEGLVELRDEKEHAYAAGFDSERGVRSWRERMRLLVKAGFVEIHRRGPIEFGYALIVHPHVAAAKLREKGLIDDDLWHLIVERARDVGADMSKLENEEDEDLATVTPLKAGANE
jgi:hypothetical protein